MAVFNIGSGVTKRKLDASADVPAKHLSVDGQLTALVLEPGQNLHPTPYNKP
jgi:hypothetical protein